MQKLLFLSRVAFICNVCFVLAWLFKYYPSLPSGHMVSMVLILGLIVAFVLNVVLAVSLLVLRLKRRPIRSHFPQWLIIINFLFLLVQLILFIR